MATEYTVNLLKDKTLKQGIPYSQQFLGDKWMGNSEVFQIKYFNYKKLVFCNILLENSSQALSEICLFLLR